MSSKIRSSYHGFVDSPHKIYAGNLSWDLTSQGLREAFEEQPGYLPHKIYAGNLSWDLTSQGLREAFEEQPGYLSAKVIYDRDSGRSRGFGFITFSSTEEVESALDNMNAVEVGGGRTAIEVKFGRAVFLHLLHQLLRTHPKVVLKMARCFQVLVHERFATRLYFNGPRRRREVK